MTIVSYAQNQEDIMLYRALRDVARGFYIDVGAQQPVVDSVTKLFYQQGWSGINIDPLPQWFEMLEADRPHDLNLQMALAEKAGRMAFFAISGTGLSTADPEFVKRHSEAGYVAQEIEVEVRTLDDICAQYGVNEVHFLKIDVEGAEESVIRGFSFDRVRPWIVVVEAVEPVAQREGDDAKDAVTTHATWEPLLLSRGYEFAYWDGLNRFYLAKEHSHLRSRFDAPPNPLDAFVRYNELAKHERILQLEDERRDLTDAVQLVAARRELDDLHGLVQTGQNRLNRIAELEQDNARLIGRMSVLEENHMTLHVVIEQLQIAVQRSNGIGEECSRLTGERDRLIAERDSLIAERDRYAEKMQVILGSRSWRLTRPFRRTARKLRVAEPARDGGRHDSARSLPRRAGRRMLFVGARFVQKHESARRIVERVLNYAPSLRGRLAAFAKHNAPFIDPSVAQYTGTQAPDIERADRSPEVLAIYSRMRSMSSSQSTRHD